MRRIYLKAQQKPLSEKPTLCATERNSIRSNCREIYTRIATRKPNGGITPDTAKPLRAKRSDLNSFFSNGAPIWTNFRSFLCGFWEIRSISHFAITDVNGEKFSYAHRKSSNGWFDYPAAASEKHYHLRLGDWSLRESHGTHILRATTSNDTIFEANLKPTKPVVLNGKAKDGVSFKDEGEASRYFSYTRMEMEGDIVWNGETEHFTGSAWMDREFGTWTPTEKQKGWDWFSIQLDNETELMCYQLRNSTNGISEWSSGTFVEKDGEFTPLSHEDFTIEPNGFWKSPRTKAVYPSGWKLKVPKFDLDLTVVPVMDDQELDTRGTTMIVYWEGACEVSGTANGKNVKGRAYIELVGYDRSHDAPNLAYFLMGSHFEFPPKFGWD